MAEDLELLDRWRAGDNAAGNELFSRHFEACYRFFRSKLGGDLDDLVQQAFLACAEARLRLREGSTFRGYLFACARNVLIDHLRGQYRSREDFDPSAMSVEDVGTSPSQFAVKRREHRMLLEALRRIPLDYQIAVELFYWEGLTGSEVAAALGVPEGTVRTHLARGRKALADRMAELEPAALVESTMDGLERWAASLRAQLDEERADRGK